MQDHKSNKKRQIFLSLEEEYIDRLKNLTTHYGQQTHEMRVAIIERIEKLERLQKENEKIAS